MDVSELNSNEEGTTGAWILVNNGSSNSSKKLTTAGSSWVAFDGLTGSSGERIAGGDDDLWGLSWNSTTATGITVTCGWDTEDGSAYYLDWLKVRVTYTTDPYSQVFSKYHSVNGVNKTNDNFLVNGLRNVHINNALKPTWVDADTVILWDKLYNFEDQTNQENGNSNWSPNNTHSNWVTGTSACISSAWGDITGDGLNLVVSGWNMGTGGTTSSNTGPNGGLHSNLDGSQDSGGKYMFVEGTGPKDDRICVARTPGFNFTDEMTSTGNDLDLEFWVHQYSQNSSGHKLYVYIDDASTSNLASATLIDSITSFTSGEGFYNSANGGSSSNYVKHTVSLNSYRAVDATHYIYFVADGATSYRCDICLDNVRFLES